jgi:hypothetical protein
VDDPLESMANASIGAALQLHNRTEYFGAEHRPPPLPSLIRSDVSFRNALTLMSIPSRLCPGITRSG